MVLVVATALIQYGYSATSRLLVILKNEPSAASKSVEKDIGGVLLLEALL